MVEDHYARLVQFRTSERAKAAITKEARSRGMSEADVLRAMVYERYGLTESKMKETP